MKNFTFAAALSAILCLSCTKSPNPRPSRHNDCAFTLSVSETRQGAHFIWNIASDGHVSCTTQSIQELWVTNWNECILEASSDDPAFDGVNFSSSDPDKLAVSPIDSKRCRLVYRSDTEEGRPVTINAWSGEGNRKEFPALSAASISLKGVMLHLGDMDIELPLSYYREKIYPDDPAYIWFDKVVDYSSYKGDILRIGHLIPENASFRHVDRLRFFSECDDIGELMGGEDFDWSEIEGKRAFVKPTATGVTFHADFDIAGKKKSCVMVGRYRYD